MDEPQGIRDASECMVFVERHRLLIDGVHDQISGSHIQRTDAGKGVAEKHSP